jgi:hypothetical protein
MSGKRRQSTTSVTDGNKLAPVRVRLRRINCDYARPYPPDGQTREWWQRLKNGLGTRSNYFVDASLQQLIAAARLPLSGIYAILLMRENCTLGRGQSRRHFIRSNRPQR